MDRIYWDAKQDGNVQIYTQNPHGFLISSKVKDGIHAPALDIDQPIRKYPVPWDSALSMLVFMKEMYPNDTYPRNDDLNAFRVVNDEFMDLGMVDDPIAVIGQRPCFIFKRPIDVVDSATAGHHHLFIEHGIPWDKYEHLLNSLAAAGIVGPTWAKNSIKDKMSMLFVKGTKHEKKPELPQWHDSYDFDTD